jgi:hypothetical protein
MNVGRHVLLSACVCSGMLVHISQTEDFYSVTLADHIMLFAEGKF